MLFRNKIRGLIIYPLGDSIAQLIQGEINFFRVGILAIVGCFLYSWEIWTWFSYIDKKFKNPFFKTCLAVSYFNPIWIARHFLFIELTIHPQLFLNAHDFGHMLLRLIEAAVKSFVGAILVSLPVNYYIQNKAPLESRFLLSATFSALMGIYYAMSKVWF